MTRRGPREGPDARRASDSARTEHATSAVYGSLLAASVVAGAGTLGTYPRLELVLLLIATSVVFWAAHVYARVVGELLAHRVLDRAVVLGVFATELPIVEAVAAPVIAVVISPLLGLGMPGTTWLALGVAVTEQVGWATVVLVREGVRPRRVVVASAVNLLLGLVIVAAKAALPH